MKHSNATKVTSLSYKPIVYPSCELAVLNVVSRGSFVIIYSSRCGFTTHIAPETIPKNLKSQTFLEGMLPDLLWRAKSFMGIPKETRKGFVYQEEL